MVGICNLFGVVVLISLGLSHGEIKSSITTPVVSNRSRISIASTLDSGSSSKKLDSSDESATIEHRDSSSSFNLATSGSNNSRTNDSSPAYFPDKEKKIKWVVVAKTPDKHLIKDTKSAFQAWIPAKCTSVTVSIELVEVLIPSKLIFRVTTTVMCLAPNTSYSSTRNFKLLFTKSNASYHLLQCYLVKSSPMENSVGNNEENLCLLPQEHQNQMNSDESSNLSSRFSSSVDKKTVESAAGVGFVLILMVMALVYSKHQATGSVDGESVFAESNSGASGDELNLEESSSPIIIGLIDGEEVHDHVHVNIIAKSTSLNEHDAQV